MQKLFRELFFGLIAIVMLSELFASNVFSLLFGMERAMQVMGLDLAQSRAHFMILIVLDAIPGISAAVVFYALRFQDNPGQLARVCVWTTAIGMLLYASYQYRFAATRLDEIRPIIQSVAVIYGLLGIIAWFWAAELRRPPDQGDAR